MTVGVGVVALLLVNYLLLGDSAMVNFSRLMSQFFCQVQVLGSQNRRSGGGGHVGDGELTG